jgi:hypothetical protein
MLTPGFGVRAQYWESEIAAEVMKCFTSQNLPLLIIHDGFVTAKSLQNTLKQAMLDAWKKVLGVPLPETAITVEF